MNSNTEYTFPVECSECLFLICAGVGNSTDTPSGISMTVTFTNVENTYLGYYLYGRGVYRVRVNIYDLKNVTSSSKLKATSSGGMTAQMMYE